MSRVPWNKSPLLFRYSLFNDLVKEVTNTNSDDTVVVIPPVTDYTPVIPPVTDGTIVVTPPTTGDIVVDGGSDLTYAPVA